jgi:cell division protein FtsB
MEAVRAGRRLRIGFQIVLLAVIGLLSFSLIFPTLRLYMSQQVQKERLRIEAETAAQVNEELEAQLARWDDPAFVKAQARQRLSFALPGDRTYRVSDPENAPTWSPSQAPGPTESAHLPQPEQPEERDPWYAELWESVIVAGQVGG